MHERESHNQTLNSTFTTRQVFTHCPEARFRQPTLRYGTRNDLINVARYPSGRLRFCRCSTETSLESVAALAPRRQRLHLPRQRRQRTAVGTTQPKAWLVSVSKLQPTAFSLDLQLCRTYVVTFVTYCIFNTPMDVEVQIAGLEQ